MIARAVTARLDPYDHGYDAGWHDIQVTRRARRKRRRLSNVEYGLGYEHGRLDGDGRGCEWWPDYAQGVAAFVAQHFVHVPGPLTAHTPRKGTQGYPDTPTT